MLGVLACIPDADMRLTVLLVIAALPLAYLGSWAEQRYRKRQNLSYNSLIIWNRRGISRPFTPERLVFQALGELFALGFALYLAGASALLACARLLQPLFAGGVQPTWPMLWIGACGGAVLALRLPRAYALAGASLVAGALLTL